MFTLTDRVFLGEVIIIVTCWSETHTYICNCASYHFKSTFTKMKLPQQDFVCFAGKYLPHMLERGTTQEEGKRKRL